MNELIGLRWGVLPIETKQWLLEGANCINGVTENNVTEGECIVDFSETLSIPGKVVDGEIIIEDSDILYNPSEGVQDEKEIDGFLIEMVMTVSEAAKRWNLSEAAIRYSIKARKFMPGVDYRKAGGTTLIKVPAMKRVYGEEK